MIEITRLARDGGPLTKRITLSPNGKLVSDGSACVMATGAAARAPLADVDAFAELIGSLKSHEAIALGCLRSDLPNKVRVTTQRDLASLNGHAPSNLIARTAGHINYRADQQALALIDIDTKGMPTAVAAHIEQLGSYWQALAAVLPALDSAARVIRTSTSSGITRADNGAAVPGSNGVHIFVHVGDGADVERFLRTLHDRCWLAGLGWMMVGAGGQLLERSLVDRTVYAAERLVFEGPPILADTLRQDRDRRAPQVVKGEVADTRTTCPPLTAVEEARLRDLKAAERTRLAKPSGEAREAFIAQQAARTAERTGCTVLAARQVAARQCAGVLLPNVALPFDAEDLAGATVADVLANGRVRQRGGN